MKNARLGFAVLVAVAAGVLSSGSAQAAIPNGGTVQGWTVTYAAPLHEGVDVTDLNNTPFDPSALHLQKFASFDAPVTPVTITFTRASAASAPGKVIIDEENVFAGVALTSFFMQLTGGATFNQAQSASLNFNPFTTRTYSAGDTLVTFGGGTVPAFSTWQPGVDAGALVIDVPPSTLSFTLIEGGVIPEPAAAGMAIIPAALLLRRRR